jgi:hypothetical protein
MADVKGGEGGLENRLERLHQARAGPLGRLLVAGKGGEMRTEDYQRRRDELAGWPVGIISYKLGDRYICEVDNVSPGARLARADGATLEEAEQRALAAAERRLARTRVHSID